MAIFGRKGGPIGVATVQAVVVDYGLGQESGVELPEGNASRHVAAQVRLVEGDGPIQTASGRLQGHAWWSMKEGDIIAVRIDETGGVVGFDRSAVEALYAARTDDLNTARKRFSSLRHLYRQDVGLERSQLSAAKDILRETLAAPGQVWREIRDTDAQTPLVGDPCPPIEGVSFSTFVEVQAALVRDRVPAPRHDDVATAMGVAPGQWAPAHEAWMRRVRSDPAVATAFGAAYQAATKRRPPGATPPADGGGP